MEPSSSTDPPMFQQNDVGGMKPDEVFSTITNDSVERCIGEGSEEEGTETEASSAEKHGKYAKCKVEDKEADRQRYQCFGGSVDGASETSYDQKDKGTLQTLDDGPCHYSKESIGSEKLVEHKSNETGRPAASCASGVSLASPKLPLLRCRELRNNSNDVGGVAAYDAFVREMISRPTRFDRPRYFPYSIGYHRDLSVQTPHPPGSQAINSGDNLGTFAPPTHPAESSNGALPAFPLGTFSRRSDGGEGVDPKSVFYHMYRPQIIEQSLHLQRPGISSNFPAYARRSVSDGGAVSSSLSKSIQEESSLPSRRNPLPPSSKRKLISQLPDEYATFAPSQRSVLPRNLYFQVPRQIFSAPRQLAVDGFCPTGSDPYAVLSYRHRRSRLPQLPQVMALPEEEAICVISPYQILIRKQIEFFEATDAEASTVIKGRKKPVVRGQVGMRCRHCADSPLHLRQRGSVYFPSNLDGLYQAGQHMANFHLTEECTSMPQGVKDEFVQILATKSKMGGGKKYWAEAATLMGLVDTPNGIRFLESTICASDRTCPQSENKKVS